jgi:hypothetical protein
MRNQIYSESEKKERAKLSVVKYLKKRYIDDVEFREQTKEKERQRYKKKKEEQYIVKHGSLEGFIVREYVKK